MSGGASLRRRLLVLVLAAVGAAWAASAAWTAADARHELDELLDGHLAQAAALLIAQGLDTDDGEAADLAPLHRYAPRVAFQVWHEGRLVLRSAGAPAQPLGPQAAGFETVRHAGEAWRVFAARGAERDVQVYVAEALGARAAILRGVLRGLLLPALAALPLLALAVAWAVHRGLRPLQSLARALEARPPAATAPLALDAPAAELRPAVDALNGLFARIGGLLERERRFTADAAHELRTPIAAIDAQAQVAQAAADPAQRAHALAAVRAGCERAARLVGQLLTLARLEAEAAPANAARCNLAAVVRQVAAELLPAAEARRQPLSIDAPATLPAALEETLAGVLVRNLLDNALRYSPAGAPVALRLSADGTRWRLVVDDAGPGLDAAARARLGERFFRADAPAASGTGLGWSIVRRIADVAGLTLALDTSPLGGLGVRVEGA